MEPHGETVGLTEEGQFDHIEVSVGQHVGHNEDLDVQLVVD